MYENFKPFVSYIETSLASFTHNLFSAILLGFCMYFDSFNYVANAHAKVAFFYVTYYALEGFVILYLNILNFLPPLYSNFISLFHS